MPLTRKAAKERGIRAAATRKKNAAKRKRAETQAGNRRLNEVEASSQTVPVDPVSPIADVPTSTPTLGKLQQNVEDRKAQVVAVAALLRHEKNALRRAKAELVCAADEVLED